MNIGIIGAGQIGSDLARKLSGLGHGIRIASSRGTRAADATSLITQYVL